MMFDVKSNTFKVYAFKQMEEDLSGKLQMFQSK